MLARISPGPGGKPRTTEAAVSSQLVSIPSTVKGFPGARIVPIYATAIRLSNGAHEQTFRPYREPRLTPGVDPISNGSGSARQGPGLERAGVRNALPHHRDQDDRRQNPGPSAL